MNMFSTRFSRMLGLKYPVIQGGMAWVAEATLAAAVSQAGGLGLIAGGAAPADVIRREIRRAKELTQRPFGINIMLISEFADDLAQLVIDEKLPVVTTGAGSPGRFMAAWAAAGVAVIPVVPSVALAKRMERLGAAAVVAEGCESGGHIGELTTMALVPQVADAVSIPVIAAGGVADGRTLAAALLLGAEGVQCGTCFLPADECQVHENYKKMILEAHDTSTIVTGRHGAGHPIRQIKNQMARSYIELEKSSATLEELEAAAAGSLRRAVQEGDVRQGSFMAGQIAGLVKTRAKAADIIETMFADAARLLTDADVQNWR
jgi:enoyl-[acyl-carrier protein] reductase II